MSLPGRVLGALLLLSGVLSACTPWEEPTGVPSLPAALIGSVPEDGARDVVRTTPIEVRFDRIPREVELRLRTALSDVPGTLQTPTNEAVVRFVPDELLDPDQGYVLEVTWADGTGRVDFATSLVGEPLDEEEIDDLPGQTWALQPLANLPELPFLPQGRDLTVLLAVQEDSDPETGELHLVVAPTVAGTELQDQCVETSVVTAGPDGLLDTDDDAPGSWDNPDLVAAGTRFATGDPDQLPPLRDWALDATVLPEREGLYVHSFSAQLSTAFLDGLVPSDGPFGGESFCTVYEQVLGGACEECLTQPIRGARCLRVELRDVQGDTRQSDLRERTCADIIGSAMNGIICGGADANYDEDGDGIYELCPEYQASR